MTSSVLFKAWSVGPDEKLLTLITGAFDVDKEDKLNTGRILNGALTSWALRSNSSMFQH